MLGLPAGNPAADPEHPDGGAREDVIVETVMARRARRLGAASAAAALIWLIAGGAALAGNNGTLKIHEYGTPDGTPDPGHGVARSWA
jgi:hypothetical protein